MRKEVKRELSQGTDRDQTGFEFSSHVTPRQPTHFENPQLFCDNFANGHPGLLLRPARRETLSLQPYVVLYHDFISDTEAEEIKHHAQLGVSGEEIKDAFIGFPSQKYWWFQLSLWIIIHQ